METQFTRNTTSDYNGNLAADVAANPSAVSWGAIFAGAAAAAALSLILLLLGTGLGLSSASPWANEGVSGTMFGVSTIIWITLTSLFASALGGYIAGRLRSRWLATHSDEIYFRDTAHGFLAWAVATLATATLLTSVIASIVSGGVKTGENIVSGAATGAAATTDMKATQADDKNSAMPYFLDSLFRKTATALPANANALSTDANTMPSDAINKAPPPGTGASKVEVAHIYMNAISTGTLPVEDIKYAGQVVAQTTGITQAEAENRVADTFKTMQTKLHDAEMAARTAADKARKASAYSSLWLFISLLIGAFVASCSAIYGGRQRDL